MRQMRSRRWTPLQQELCLLDPPRPDPEHGALYGILDEFGAPNKHRQATGHAADAPSHLPEIYRTRDQSQQVVKDYDWYTFASGIPWCWRQRCVPTRPLMPDLIDCYADLRVSDKAESMPQLDPKNFLPCTHLTLNRRFYFSATFDGKKANADFTCFYRYSEVPVYDFT
jgi:hypothetical protein